MKGYHKTLISLCLIVSGSVLIIEHLLVWGGFDYVFGHEWIGLLLIILGMMFKLKKRIISDRQAKEEIKQFCVDLRGESIFVVTIEEIIKLLDIPEDQVIRVMKDLVEFE